MKKRQILNTVTD